MNRRARQRLKVFLVLFCLLFQQVALAAYLCPLEQAPTPASVMAGSCDGMDLAPDRDHPALCQKHCSPDVLVAADHAPPTVPALAVAPPIHALVLAPPPAHRVVHAEVAIAASDPPPRLRFCSWLI